MERVLIVAEQRRQLGVEQRRTAQAIALRDRIVEKHPRGIGHGDVIAHDFLVHRRGAHASAPTRLRIVWYVYNSRIGSGGSPSPRIADAMRTASSELPP